MGGSGMWGFGFLWPLLWLLVIAVLVIGVVYLFRVFRDGTTAASDGDSDRAMELVREQYARGEISDEEFEERTEKLTSR